MPPTKFNRAGSVRLTQGALFRDIEWIESVVHDGSSLHVKTIQFPFVVVLTQDCDLSQEHNVRWPQSGEGNQRDPTRTGAQDKFLFSALVAPLYNAEQLFAGQHLSELQMSMQTMGRDIRNVVKQNSQPRYHYLEFAEDTGLPSMIVDFKHYFSIPTESLYAKIDHMVGTIGELYRERLSQRFTDYLSRIALPD